MIITNNSRTQWVHPKLGVPQGSALGPLLFILASLLSYNVPSNCFACARNWRLSEHPHFRVSKTTSFSETLVNVMANSNNYLLIL